MSAAPRVSVLLASRDGERHLPQALASLAEQTYRDFELVAVDDGSRDGTGALLADCAARHDWCRVLRTEGIGLAGALALAAREARGELLARHDDDDESDPGRLHHQVAHLDLHAHVGVLGTAARIIGERGELLGAYPVPLTEDAIRRTLRRAPPFVHGSVMMRRSVYEAAGGYRSVFRASQDFDLWLRLAPGTGLANLPEPLYHWRLHAHGTYTRARAAQLFYSAAARTLAGERRRRGRDSAELLAAAADPAAFAAAHADGAEFLRIFGEVLVREGRTREARRSLGAALGRGAWGALPWWLLSWPVALTPRARRADGVS